MPGEFSLQVLTDSEKSGKSALVRIIEVLRKYHENNADKIKKMVLFPSLHVRSIYAPNGYTLSFSPSATFDPSLFFTHMYGGLTLRHVPTQHLSWKQKSKLLAQMDGWFPLGAPNRLFCHASELSLDLMEREVKRYRETLGSSKTFVGLFSAEITDESNVATREFYIVINSVPTLTLADEIDGLHIDLKGKTVEQVATHPKVLKIRRTLRENRLRLMANMLILLGLEDETVPDVMSDYMPKKMHRSDEISMAKFNEAAAFYLENSLTNRVHIGFEFSAKASVKDSIRGYEFGYNLYLLKNMFSLKPELHKSIPKTSKLLDRLELMEHPHSTANVIDIEYNYLEPRDKQVVFYNDSINTHHSQGIGVFIQSPLKGISLLVDYHAGKMLVGQDRGNRCLNSLPIEYPRARAGRHAADNSDKSHVAGTFTTDSDNPFKSAFFSAKHVKWSPKASEAFGITGQAYTKRLLHLSPEVVRFSMDE